MKKMIKVAAVIAVFALITASCASAKKEGGQEPPVAADFVLVSGSTFDGTTALTPESRVFFEGRTVEIGDLYVCDHEVTQEEYETYCVYFSSYPREEYHTAGKNFPASFMNWYDALVYCNLRSLAEGLTPVYSLGGETDPRKWEGMVAADSDDKDGMRFYLRSIEDGFFPVYKLEEEDVLPRSWEEMTAPGNGVKFCGLFTNDDSRLRALWDGVSMDMSAGGYRLPTDAEWEYVARGADWTSTYTYSGSDDIDEVAWWYGNDGGETHDVKTKKPNALGIYDMTGSVREMCWDWYYQTLQPSTPATGPVQGTMPFELVFRVVRGGEHVSAFSHNVSVRSVDLNMRTFMATGFRVVRSAYGR